MLADFTTHLQQKTGHGQQKLVRLSRWTREEQFSAFLTWLPRELHDAPGIDWTRLSIQAAGYLVRNVGTSPDAAYLAVAAASAMDAISNDWLQSMLCSLRTLLRTLRMVSETEGIDLYHEQSWHALAQLPKNVRTQLKAYSSVTRKHVPAYLERLSTEERQRMQCYALPPLPPDFLKQYTGVTTQQPQQETVQRACSYIAERCRQSPDVTCKELREGLRSIGIRMGTKRVNSLRRELDLRRPGGSIAQHLRQSRVHAQARDWLAKERRQNPEVRVQELQAGLQRHFGIEKIGTRQLDNILKELGVARSRYHRAHEEVSRKTNASAVQASTHEG